MNFKLQNDKHSNKLLAIHIVTIIIRNSHFSDDYTHFFSEIIETTTLLSAFRKWFWETRNKESRKPKCFLLCHYNNLIHFFFGAETNADKTSWVVSFYFIFQSIFHHRAFSCVFCSFIVFKIYTYNTTTDPDNIYIVISLLSYTLCHLIFCFVHSHFCSCILLNVSRTF